MAQGNVYQHPKDSRMLAVFPIAFPIMVGPGAITVTIITTGAIGQLLMAITAAVTFSFVFLIARNADRLMRLVGPYAGMMIARLLYIFLAAKAVAMILKGLTQFIEKFIPAEPNAVSMLF